MRTKADGKATRPTRAAHSEDLIRRMVQHQLRYKILIRTGERPWCPAEIAEDTGEPLKRVNEHVDVLLRQAPPFLELVGEHPGPKGGPPRHYYRALVRVNADSTDWSKLTSHEKAARTVTITEEIHGEWIASINSGAFYEDPDHVLMRNAFPVDREGAQEVDEVMCELEPRFAEIQRKAAERRSHSGEKAIRLITCAVSFPAAPSE